MRIQTQEIEADEPEALEPMIVAEFTFEISTLTAEEAVARLDPADLAEPIFCNRPHSGLNLVYRRPDGNIGWIDPRAGRREG